jgi:hypothetical protein
MRAGYLLVGLITTLALVGCKLSPGGGDDDTGIAMGFSVQWELSDWDTKEAINCEDARAETVRIEVIDSKGTTHEYYWFCSDGNSENDRELAAGNASVTVELLGGDTIVSEVTFPHTLSSDTDANDLGLVDFGVRIFDPVSSADSSIEWQWRNSDSVDDWMSAADCEAAGIDYVYLWVWNPYTQTWWTDPGWTEFACEAHDHGDGEGLWSGLHIPDFLEAGNYQLSLGFYQEVDYKEGGGDTTDLLMYHDTRSVPLVADATADDYNDLGFTVIDPGQEAFGVLKIHLIWHQIDGTQFADCYNSNVDAMGFVLRNSGSVAAEVPVGADPGCLDWLVFEEVPVLSDAYELLVTGATVDQEILWFALCTGLDPEEVDAPNDAAGFICEIENQLAP